MGIAIYKPIVAIVMSCVIWGLSGIYYSQLSHIPALEVLAHRSLWAMVFFSGALFFRGGFSGLKRFKINIKQILLLGASALMISANWFSFIFAIQTNQAVQAAFGYYIFPLVAVVLGFVFKQERFSFGQSVSIIFAAVAVAGLGVALRLVPSIALIIAVTFGAYGLIKSFVRIGAVESVTIETILIAPFSLGFLCYLYISKSGGTYEASDLDFLLLVLSGVITGGPLILFSYATKKLNYATVGILQYINPTLQFVVAITIFLEPFNMWHSFALICIWIGIIIYSTETWRLQLIR
jgi:chloramphenicol-sensitive protein RarD